MMPYIQPNFGISWFSEPKSVGIIQLVSVGSCQQKIWSSASHCNFHLGLKYSVTSNFLDILKARKGGKHIKTARLKEFVTSTHNLHSPKFSEEFTIRVFCFLLYTGPALPDHDFNHSFSWVYLPCYNILSKLFVLCFFISWSLPFYINKLFI